MGAVLPDMSPWLLVVLLPLVPRVVRWVWADFSTLAHLIDHPEDLNERRQK